MRIGGEIMRKGIAATALLSSCILSTQTFADDWDGLYVGLHAGYGWSDARGDYDFGDFNDVLFDVVGISPSLSTDLDGYVAGGQVGLQRQFGNIVLGIEGTLSATDLSGSASADWGLSIFNTPFLEGTQSLNVDMDDLYTVTGRVGFAQDRWLAYLKGGYASADVAVHSAFAGNILGLVQFGAAGSSEKRHDGWIIGGGVEHLIHPNLTLGVEYNYIDLGSRTHTVDSPLVVSGVGAIDASHKVKIDPDEIHTVALRLNFKFGAHESVAPPLK